MRAGSCLYQTVRSGLFLCDLIKHQTKSNWHLGDLYYYQVVGLSCLPTITVGLSSKPLPSLARLLLVILQKDLSILTTTMSIESESKDLKLRGVSLNLEAVFVPHPDSSNRQKCQ